VCSPRPLTPFTGCLDALKIDTSALLINLNSEESVREAKGVTPGCGDMSVRTASSVAQTKGDIVCV
jgi:hypothetical protein